MTLDAISLGVSAASAAYTSVANVKKSREQCRTMSARCKSIITSWQDLAAGLEGQRALEQVDVLQSVLEHIERKVSTLDEKHALLRWLQQDRIKEDIDKLNADMNYAISNFNSNLNLELAHGQMEARQRHERDISELKELIIATQNLVRSLKAVETMLPALSPSIPQQISPVADSSASIRSAESSYSPPSSSKACRRASSSYRVSLPNVPYLDFPEEGSTIDHTFDIPYIKKDVEQSLAMFTPVLPTQAELLTRASTDGESVIQLGTAGQVTTATLKGLCDRLMSKNATDSGFRDVFLMCCTDFTSPQRVFEILRDNFDVAKTGRRTEERINVQSNILGLSLYWISTPHLYIDELLLQSMETFFRSYLASDSPGGTMAKKTEYILCAIVARRQSNRGIPPSPTGSVPRSWRKFTYKNMAIAMSVLDGALYRSILPCDYLCMDSSASIRAVHKHNRRLTRWVQFCILGKKETSSTVESRVEAVEYFVNTAKECQKRRDFSAVAAIASAILSPAIECLVVTKQQLSPSHLTILSDMEVFLSPNNDYQAYRAAIGTGKCRDNCVPWLVVHLESVSQCLSDKTKAVIGQGGQALINFTRYVKFVECLNKEGLQRFKPPDLESDCQRQELEVAYLVRCLRKVDMSKTILDELSRTREIEETRDALQCWREEDIVPRFLFSRVH